MAAPKDNRAWATGAAPTRTGTGRRKLLIGSAPVMLTLASQPAFARVCTASAAASFNANHSSGNPIAGLTCAVAPSCWTLRASNEGNGAWLGTSYTPGQLFATVFAGPGLQITGNTSWRSTTGATLGDALASGVTIQYVRNPSNTFILGTTFAAEAVAALLNASFDATYPNGFPLTVAQVLGSVTSLWAYDPPGPPGDTNADDADELADEVNGRITAYMNARDNGEPCDL